MKKLYLTACAALFILSTTVRAQQKPSYSLFKPVPKAQMRDMETDRPDKTETPYTVDAGHFQYEADLVRLQQLTTEQSKQRQWLVNQAILKLGLLNSTDLQLVVQTYGREINRDIATHQTETSNGFGDLTVRIKQNLYGNNSGNFSIALVPYVKFPTNKFSDNKMYEEGLIIPIQIKLPHDWKLGLQAEADYLKDDEGNSRHAELMQSVVLSHEIVKNLEALGETFYTYNFKEHQMNNFLDAAIAYKPSKNLMFDVGLNYGIQHHAEKEYFVGLSFRY